MASGLELATAYVSLSVSTRGLGRDIAREFAGAERQAQASGKRIGGHLSGGLAVLGGAAVAGGAALVAGLGASISKAADFDKTMRTVGATLGASGPVQKDLNDFALKLGKETAFSAGEASEAMLELAKGGMDAVQIKSGALAETLTLASAGGLGLADAATYMSNSLNTFGLPAKDAGRVAAALAGAANASTASVESMGQALSQVGPGAKTAGLSLETTTGILAAFDNAGIKGSDAGTSLKTMLTRLVPSTKAARNAMADLGLKFTDANGQFLPMTNIAQQLQDKLKGLSDEQRTTALATIFGSDATRAATVLADLGAKGVAKYTKATSDQGAAQRMAKTQTEGASGAWESFQGTLETIAITIGQKLLPFVEKLIRGANDIAGSVLDKMGPALEGVIGTVELFLGALTGDGADVEVPWMNTVIDAGASTRTALDGIMAAVKPLIPVLVEFVTGTLVPLFQKAADFILTYLVPAFTEIVKAVVGFVETALPIVTEFVNGLIDRLEPMMPQVQRILTSVSDVIVSVTEFISGVWEKWGQGLMDTVGLVFQTVLNVIEPAFQTIRGVFDVFAAALSGDWQGAWEALKGVFSTAWATVRAAIEGAVGLLGRALKIAWDGIVSVAGTVWEGLLGAISGPIDRAMQFIQENLIDKINGLFAFLKIPIYISPIWKASNVGTGMSFKGANKGTLNKMGWSSLAQGGVLPGWSPGRDIHEFFSATGGRLSLSGGEAIMRPEFTRAVGGKRGIDLLNRAARKGQAFANGGVFEAVRNVASSVAGFASDPLGSIKELAARILGGVGDNPMARLVAGLVGRVIPGLIQKVQDMFGGGIPATATTFGGQRVDADTARRLRAAGGMRVIQGSWSFNPLSQGTHAGAGAVDLVASDWGAAVARLRAQGMLAMFRNWPGNQHIHALNPFVQGLSPQALAQVKRARANGGVFKDGGVLQPRLMDQGGFIAPGRHVIDNKLGHSETVLPFDIREGGGLISEDLIDRLAERIGQRVERGAYRGISQQAQELSMGGRY